MTWTCPHGHQSETADYCDQCGARIEGAGTGTAAAPTGTGTGGPTPLEAAAAGAGAGSPAAPGVAPEPAPATVAGSAPGPTPGGAAPGGAALCPVCWTPRIGDDRFCEGCGFDFAAPAGMPPAASAPAASAEWEAVATADRDYFERIAPEGVTFPPHCPPRVYAVAGDEIRIGRRSNSRGIQPEVDLSGAPEDAAISHLHCLLLRQPDGGYTLVDPGSTNGTTLNDDPTPLVANTPVPLADGDRIHLGAWTTITVRHRPDGALPGSGS